MYSVHETDGLNHAMIIHVEHPIASGLADVLQRIEPTFVSVRTLAQSTYVRSYSF